MCLAVPARVVAVEADGLATVSLAGTQRQVALDLVPDARVGDYVIVHVGFAIQRLDEAEARRTLEYFDSLLGEDAARPALPSDQSNPSPNGSPSRGPLALALVAALVCFQPGRADEQPKEVVGKPRRADRGGIQWRPTLALAQTQSGRSGRPILALFGARWCRFCKLMDESTLGEAGVVGLVNAEFLPVRVDVDDEPALVEHYQTERTPTTLVIRPNGQVAARLVGYRDAATYVQELKRALKSLAETPPASGSVALLREFEAAEQLFKRGKLAMAYAAYSRLAALDVKFAEAELARRRLAEIDKLAADELAQAKKAIDEKAFAEAAGRLERLIAQFGGADAAVQARKLKEELTNRPEAKAVMRRATAERLYEQALADLDKEDFGSAILRFETVVKDYGDQRVANDARQELARLRKDPKITRKANDQAAASQSTVWLSIARTWKANGRPERAKAYFEKVIKTFPGTSFAEDAAKELAELK